MDDHNQAASQVAFEAPFLEHLNAELAAAGALPTHLESLNHQSQGHGNELQQEQPAVDLWPITELPNENVVYDNLHDLMKEVHAYGLRTGCDLIRRGIKTTAKGQPGYRWMMTCSRSGSAPTTTPTIRPNTRSKKCNCPFGFWCIALDRMSPTTSQYRIALSDGHHQHNHSPDTIATLPNARRRARRQPETEAQRQQITQVGARVSRLERMARATRMSNGQNATLLDKPIHLLPKDVIRLLGCIRDLQLFQVQWMVDYFELPRSPSPVTVTPEPNQLLAALYKRCWGDEWRRDGDMLLRQNKRSVFNDAMALISSFLFENILTAAVPHLHPTLTSESAATLLGTRTEPLQTKLIAALGPFFSALVQLTRAMYSTPFDGNVNPLLDPAFQHFETALSEIVAETVALKYDMETSDLRPTFVWPGQGELYDAERMQPAHPVYRNLAVTYTVAYTTFPGVMMPRPDDPTGFTAFRAFVVLQAVANR